MKLEIINGALCVTDEGETLFGNLYVGLRYGGPEWSTIESYLSQKFTTVEKAPLPDCFAEGECYKASAEDAAVWAVFTDDKTYFRTEYYNTTAKGFAPQWGSDFVALGGVWCETIEKCVYNSWSCRNGVSTNEMQSDIALKILGDMEVCDSATHVAFLETEGSAVSCGFVSFDNYFSGVSLRGDGRIECQLRLDNNFVPENKTIKSDWICFEFADTLQEALCDYAAEVKEFNRVTLRFDKAPVGFCTWYYYLFDINENSIYDNMEVIDRIKKDVPLEVFQIDDGWGGSHGGEGNGDRFPKGMPKYAEFIKEHGMTAGIWLTPFNFGTWEPFVKDHPECFVHRGEDFVLVENQAIIDATHPTSKQYIKDLYHRLTYDWGYRYIKLDHVATYLTGGEFYDKEACSINNMRAYFEAMREGCHPDTYILACTSPMIELAGLVDGVRVSGDIFESWPSIFGVLRRDLNRFYTNGVLFWNDPDCYMVRTKDEQDENCHRLCSRTPLENRTFATAMYTAGGALMFSDKLPLLKEEQLRDYAKFFPRNKTPGVPLDMGESFMPSVFDLGEDGGVYTVSFINWGDREKDFAVALDGKFEATEHWDDTPLGTFEDEYSVTLPPHASQLVHFKRIK